MRTLWTHRCDGSAQALVVPTGKDLVCVGTSQGDCLLLDMSGALVAEPLGVADDILALATCVDCTMVFAGGRSTRTGHGFVATCAPSTGRVTRVRTDAPVTCLAVFGTQPWLAVGTADGQVRLHGTSMDGELQPAHRTVRLSRLPITQLASLGDDRPLVALAEDGTSWVLDPYTDAPLALTVGIRLGALAAPAGDRTTALAVDLDNNLLRVPFTEPSTGTVFGRWPSDAPVEQVAAASGDEVVVGASATDLYLLYDDAVVESARVDGRITGIGMTAQADIVLVTTAAGVVHAFATPLTPAGTRLRREETHLSRVPAAERPLLADRLYARIGLPALAVQRLRHLATIGVIDGSDADRLITAAARQDEEAVNGNPTASLAVAEAFARLGEPGTALGYYQRASACLQLRSRALRATGDCFRTLGAAAAADTCYRRSAHCEPTEAEKRVLYELACRWQAQQRWQDAAHQFETLLSWEVDFHDALARYIRCRQLATAVRPGGPAAPPARRPGSMLGALHDLADRGLLTPLRSSLHTYDASAYARYEVGPAQDTVKKRLEMANLVALIDPGHVTTSLDVGTATFRYPKMLRSLGIDSIGIDIRDEGVRSWTAHRERLRFVVANATALPFRSRSFALVTCMMGTVNHLAAPHRHRFLDECRRTLRPGGQLVLSCWDPDCPFQSYLTMYSPAELLDLRARLFPVDIALAELTRFGFIDLTVTPFCLFPDWMAADLNTSPSDRAVLTRLAEFDAEVRQRWPDRSGQMFLLSARLSGGDRDPEMRPNTNHPRRTA